MTNRRLWLIAGILLVAAAGIGIGVWALYPDDPAVSPPRSEAPPAGAATTPTSATARIEATLFYGAPEGDGLVTVRREVPLSEPQGASILEAQFGPAPEPYVSVIPEGTTLRAFYVTDQGDAFVDVSREIATAHPGGSAMELLTVYAIVNAVTANLPNVQRVQILVDGKEVDTIAGHVDVRRPLAPDTSLVREKK